MRKRARIDDRGKVLIPKELRKKIGIEPGQEVILENINDGLRIEKVDEDKPDLHELAKKVSGGM